MANNRQARYEKLRREAGGKTVSARLNAEQESVVKTAGGATLVLRAIADAILAGGEIQIIAGEGERGTVIDYDGARTIPAIRQRLGRERAGGDRWARAQVRSHNGPDGSPVFVDAETGDFI